MPARDPAASPNLPASFHAGSSPILPTHLQHRPSIASPNSSGFSSRNSRDQHIEYGSLGNGDKADKDGTGFVHNLLRRVSADRGGAATNQPIHYEHQGGDDIYEEDEDAPVTGNVPGPSQKASLDMDA